jgi:ABC-type transport system substrate-binding protein
MGGLGETLSTEYMGPKYPGYDASKTVNRTQLMDILKSHGLDNTPEYKSMAASSDSEAWPWAPKFDVAMANTLLDKAGYPKGANGTRFAITLNANQCELGAVCYAVNDAVGAMWAQVGVNATILREDYGTVISPRMRMRNQSMPVIKNGDVNANNFPLDWPFPPVDSALTRPGWGVGFESDVLSTMHLKIRSEQDMSKRVQMHLDTVNYMQYWHLYAGIIQQPKGLLYSPTKVAGWTSRPAYYSIWANPSYIKLVGQ